MPGKEPTIFDPKSVSATDDHSEETNTVLTATKKKQCEIHEEEKVNKTQEVWENFLEKLSEEGLTFQDISDCEEKAKYIGSLGFSLGKTAVITTRWNREVKGKNTTEARKESEIKELLFQNKRETMDEQFYPHIRKNITNRFEIDEFRANIIKNPELQGEKYRQEVMDKVRGKGIDPYNAMILRYLLAEDKKLRLAFAHLLLHKNEKEIIHFHNLMLFDSTESNKRGEKALLLDFLEVPLLDPIFGELNAKLFRAAKINYENNGKSTVASKKLYDEVYLCKEEEVTGGELHLDIMPNGRVNADVIETEVNIHRGALQQAYQSYDALKKQVEELSLKVEQQQKELQQTIPQRGIWNRQTSRGRGGARVGQGYNYNRQRFNQITDQRRTYGGENGNKNEELTSN